MCNVLGFHGHRQIENTRILLDISPTPVPLRTLVRGGPFDATTKCIYEKRNLNRDDSSVCRQRKCDSGYGYNRLQENQWFIRPHNISKTEERLNRILKVNKINNNLSIPANIQMKLCKTEALTIRLCGVSKTGRSTTTHSHYNYITDVRLGKIPLLTFKTTFRKSGLTRRGLNTFYQSDIVVSLFTKAPLKLFFKLFEQFWQYPRPTRALIKLCQ